MPTETDEATALLIRARGLLERGWCRGVFARDADGLCVPETSDRAVAWCAFGALLAAGMPFKTTHPAVVRLQNAIGECRPDGIAAFNNAQETVGPILAAFDRAIAACGSP